MSRKDPRVVVDGHSERWLRRGFPWVYRDEVSQRSGAPGEVVAVHARSGELLGRGLLDDGWIAVRIYRWGEQEGPLDRPWLHATLERALRLREQLFDARTTAFRVVNGESDGLPGIRLDWWDHYATLILDSPAVEPLVEEVIAWLGERLAPRGVVLCHRPDPRDDRLGELRPKPVLRAGHSPPGPVRVLERAVAFEVDPLDAPDVGLYPDMRDLRAWLADHWGATSVLNTFAYTGAFSVVAALGGASEIVSVDLSRRALERAERNLQINGLDPAGFEFLVEDTFKALDHLRRKGRRFDRIILDPPSFSRSAEGVWSAKQDLPRLVAAAVRVLAPEGWLIAASNQGDLSPKQFDGLVQEGARRADAALQRLHTGSQTADHPAGDWFPEGRYLKVGVWRRWG